MKKARALRICKLTGACTFVLVYGLLFLISHFHLVREPHFVAGCIAPLLYGPWLAALWIWWSWPPESETGMGFSPE